MPKIISDTEIQRVKDLMFEKVLDLIKEKRLPKVTVEDITKSVGISKGSFYRYYNSKEALIYEVIKLYESNMFLKVVTIDFTGNKKDQINNILEEIYLANDSLLLYITPEEFAYLLRKLPEEIYQKEIVKSRNYFEKTFKTLGINPINCDINVLAPLMDCLQFIVSNNSYGNSKQKALKIIINSIAEYLVTCDIER